MAGLPTDRQALLLSLSWIKRNHLKPLTGLTFYADGVRNKQAVPYIRQGGESNGLERGVGKQADLGVLCSHQL